MPPTRFPYGVSGGLEVDAGNGAIKIVQGVVLITKGSAIALTLPLPIAGSVQNGDDGCILRIIATTAFAHTVTTPADGINGTKDTVTFAAVGDFVDLVAYNGVWYAIVGGPTPASLSEV